MVGFPWKEWRGGRVTGTRDHIANDNPNTSVEAERLERSVGPGRGVSGGFQKRNACQQFQQREHSSRSCTCGPLRDQRISFIYRWCWCVFAMFGSKCRILENCSDDSVEWCIMMFNGFGTDLIPSFDSFLSEMLGWKPMWEQGRGKEEKVLL